MNGKMTLTLFQLNTLYIKNILLVNLFKQRYIHSIPNYK